MALDIQALKNKLNQLQKKSSDNIFKPEEGETTIRIVPLKSDPTNPFIQVYFHYNLGGKTYLSPLTYGERDPIAEFSDALIAEGGLSKDEFKAAKRFFPTLRTYVPIVVRGKEAEGVKYWAFGKQIFEQLLKIMTDEEYGDITDVLTGTDLKLTFTPQEKSDTNFAKTEIIPKRKPSPLTADEALLNKLLNNQPDLLEGFKRHTAEELEAVLHKYLNAEVASEDETEGETKTEDASEDEAPAKTEAPAKVSADIEAEFDQIFNS
jgi:hypothetical protein